jgi:hypothetical protein
MPVNAVTRRQLHHARGHDLGWEGALAKKAKKAIRRWVKKARKVAKKVRSHHGVRPPPK